MVKKNKKKKAKVATIQLGGALKQILMTAATHPATACLAVMSLTVVGQLINGNPSPEDKRRWETRGQLAGLYDGAQKLGAACALAPVVVGALGVAKAGIEAYAGRPVEAELGYP